jgi:elongation factor G
MGELHLDVYIERMKREYKAEVVTSPPQVAYRETITKKVEFNYTHKKQTGGSGQYGRVAGYAEPHEGPFEFLDSIKGGAIPREFIVSVEKGFKSMIPKSPRLGVPVVNLRVAIDDGQAHAVDSSDIAFQEAARGAFRDFFPRGNPKILEPIMKVSMEGPAEFSGNMLSLIMQRRGIVQGSTEEDGNARVDAEVPLAEMFGFSTPLRSATQGKAEFTMEFARYAEVPGNISEELLKKAAQAKLDAKK